VSLLSLVLEMSVSGDSMGSGRRASGGHKDTRNTMCLQQNGPWQRPAATLKRESLPGPPVWSTRISEPRRSRSQSADNRLGKALETKDLNDLREAFSKSLDERRERHVTNSRNVLRVQLMILGIHDRRLREAMEPMQYGEPAEMEGDIESLRALIKDAESDEAIASRGRSKQVILANKFLEQKVKARMKALGIKKAEKFDDPEYGAEIIKKLKAKLKAAAYDNGKLNWDKLTDDFDKDDDGTMDFREFELVVRKVGKIDKYTLPQDELEWLWKHVNKDGDESINFKGEFLPWLYPGGEIHN